MASRGSAAPLLSHQVCAVIFSAPADEVAAFGMVKVRVQMTIVLRIERIAGKDLHGSARHDEVRIVDHNQSRLIIQFGSNRATLPGRIILARILQRDAVAMKTEKQNTGSRTVK